MQVRQEVFAARELDILIGDYIISWSSLLNFMRSKYFHVMTEQVKGLNRHQLSQSVTGQYAFGRISADHIPLTERLYGLLIDGVNFDASDDRDRIYAMYGMTDQLTNYTLVSMQHTKAWTEEFPIDYTISLSSVYQKLIKVLINTDRTLMCLEYLRPKNSNAPDLPSWAINWGRSFTSDFSTLYSLTNTMLSYAINDETIKAVMSAPTQMMEANGQLRLLGIRLGKLSKHRVDHMISDGNAKYLFESLAPRGRHSKIKHFTEEVASMVRDGSLCLWTVKSSEDAEASDYSGVVTTADANDNDLVVILHGSRLMHILRPAVGSGLFTLISSGWFWTRQNPGFPDYSATSIAEKHQVCFRIDFVRFAKLLDGCTLAKSDFEKFLCEIGRHSSGTGYQVTSSSQSGVQTDSSLETYLRDHEEAFTLV